MWSSVLEFLGYERDRATHVAPAYPPGINVRSDDLAYHRIQRRRSAT